jgi:F-type H+-transporting ATPase subunit gamma
VDSFRQEVTVQTLLPYVYKQPETVTQTERKYIEYEPSMEDVLNYLIPKYVEVMIYDAMIESATSEHAARRMAMENASDSAKDMIKQLSLKFNQARQAAITNEITEVVRGAEAVK